MAEYLKRLKSLGKRRLYRRSLLLFCLVWCTAMLLPLFLVSFSVYPAHDDFALTLDVTEAWLRTGSLWAAGEAAIDRAIYMYNTWQGTISASLLLAIQPMVFSPNLYFLTPMITLCGLCLAVAYFSKALI